MNQKIFRKDAVERLSSPENLDQVMQLVPAKNWIALLCLFAVVAILVAWAFLGEIVRQVGGSGALLAGMSGEAALVLGSQDGSFVQEGMEAYIVLPSRKDLVLSGRVTHLQPVDGPNGALGVASLPLENLPGWSGGDGGVVAYISLDAKDAAQVQEFLLATSPETLDPSMGWLCEAEIVVERFPPIRLILPEGTENNEAS